MAAYEDMANKYLPLKAGDSVPSTADYTNWMTEGLQHIINAVPTDMLWMFETSSDFIDAESAVEGVSVGTNKILYVQRESDSYLIDTVGGVKTFTLDNSLAVAWEADKTWYNVSQKSSTKDGKGALFTIVTNNSGVTTFTKTASGGGYSEGEDLTFVDPGSTSNTRSINVDTVTISGINDDKMLVECREVPASLRGRITPGSGYMEEASETDPIWYKLGGKVYMFPVSTSINSKIYWVKNPPSGMTGNSTYLAGTSGIPIEVDPAVMEYIIYKALCGETTKVVKSQLDDIKDLHTTMTEVDAAIVKAVAALDRVKLFVWDNNTNSYAFTKVKTALERAENLIADYSGYDDIADIVDSSSSEIFSAIKWLEEEELELLQGAVQLIQVEIQRAQSESAQIDQVSKTALSEAQGFFGEVTGRLGLIQSELAEYAANTQARGALFQEFMGLSQKYFGQFQQALGLLIKGYMPETGDDIKRPPTYTGLAQ